MVHIQGRDDEIYRGRISAWLKEGWDFMTKAEEVRKIKAMQRRNRKAVAAEMNIDTIREQLADMGEACAEVHWFVDSEDGQETLVDALDSEDDAWEFRMAFSSLLGDIERMQDDMDPYDCEFAYNVPEVFDDFMAAIRASVDGRGLLKGYDDYEEDYFGLGGYEADEAVQISCERLKRLTKDDLISAAQRCFNVAMQFIGLRARYDDLKDAIDILKGKNASFLQQVRAIEAAYETATKDGWASDTRAFDKMLAQLPERCWIE